MRRSRGSCGKSCIRSSSNYIVNSKERYRLQRPSRNNDCMAQRHHVMEVNSWVQEQQLDKGFFSLVVHNNARVLAVCRQGADEVENGGEVVG